MAKSGTHPNEISIFVDPNSNVQPAAREEEQGTGARMPTRKQIFDLLLEKEKEASSPTWGHHIFTALCSIGVLIDPLFCYIAFLDHDYKCLTDDSILGNVYVALRSALDMLYLMKYIMKAYNKVAPYHRRSITRTIRTLLSDVHRSFLVLPIPQLVIYGGDMAIWILLLFVCFPLQYALRVAGSYKSLNDCSNSETGIGRWLKAALDIFPFILAAHLIGALWHYIAVTKMINCWVEACVHDTECNVGLENSTYISFCTEKSRPSMTVLNLLDKSCPTSQTYGAVFDASMTSSRNIYVKVLQGFWWGLRNLSSFGSNLQTSLDATQILFSIFVSISGIMLFIIYLNGRIEVSKKKSKNNKLRLILQMLNQQIDLWISQNDLSKMPAISKDSKPLKNVIMKNARERLEGNKDADLSDIFSILPLRYKEQVIHFIGLASLSKVPMFQNINEEILGDMCKFLKPVMYAVGDCILQEGEPLEMMLFIRRGTVWLYTTSANGRTASKVSVKVTRLQKGDLAGEQLIDWVSIGAPFSEFPISTAVVKAQTKVEGFAIRASDLKTFFSRSWRHFPDKKLRRIWAACLIQAVWRMHRVRELRLFRAARFIQAVWRMHRARVDASSSNRSNDP